MSTIYDIAQLSGTSAATVSYVLNGRGDEKRISQATQQRVLAAAERLNYHPNITARQLKGTGRAMMRIAAFWPEFYFDQPLLSAMRAIKETVGRNDEVEISIHFFAPSKLSEKLRKFPLSNYNGLLLAGASMEDLSLLSSCRSSVPIVLINRRLEGFPSAGVDQESAGAMAFDLATRYAGTEVLSIWDTRFHVATNLRKSAFERRCAEEGLDLSGAEYSCEGSIDGGYELGLRLVKRALLKKLIYCNNESIARGVLTALAEHDIRVGSEVLLFTANSALDSFCRYSSPAMSCIDLRMQEVFGIALQKCIQLIGRSDTVEPVTTLQPRMVWRDSLPEF